jgi:hypothetical protein
MSNEGLGSRRDHLTATTPEGKIELTEKELCRAVGGFVHKFNDAVAGDLSATIKFKFTTI